LLNRNRHKGDAATQNKKTLVTIIDVTSVSVFKLGVVGSSR
jgi:hypothetical protein